MSTTKTVLAWVRFVPTISWSMLLWLVGILACAAQLADFKKLKFQGAGILTTEWRPWFAKHYPYSLTLGRTMIFFPGAQEQSHILEHEAIHVAQVEDLMLLSLLVGVMTAVCTGDALFGFVLWTSGGMWQVPNYFMAMLRYGHLLSWPTEGTFGDKLKKLMRDLFVNTAYANSEHERSAYAQTAVSGSDGETWAELRDKRD